MAWLLKCSCPNFDFGVGGPVTSGGSDEKLYRAATAHSARCTHLAFTHCVTPFSQFGWLQILTAVLRVQCHVA
jgi:hypothetical protein